MKIRVHVKPGGKNREETVIPGEVWEVSVQARAEDGRANEAVIRLLAKHFGVTKSRVRIVHGAASRHKTIEIIE